MATDSTMFWYPIARSDDLPPRHVYLGQLLGRELAVWRADDGYTNIWENRCLHRGVRLSIGRNEGRELSCQYHGWRYANRTAGCTYIPAHPANAPARTICNVTYPVVERYGLVWTCAAPTGAGPLPAPPVVARLEARSPFGLRNLPVTAEPDGVRAALEEYRFRPSALVADHRVDDRVEMRVVDARPTWVELAATVGSDTSTVVMFVQPVDAGRTVIRGVLTETPVGEDRNAVLRHHHLQLGRLREHIEKQAALRPAPVPMVPALNQVSFRAADSSVPRVDGRQPALRVTVARRSTTAAGIESFELRPVDGPLVTFQPGAHVDVHLSNGLVRQYSLVNGPGELDRYVIGVKLEPESRGGSAFLHDSVREGDMLAISEPRNTFPLRRDSFRTILIAGGIGVTPLLSMAQALHVSRLTYELHYFAQSSDHLAFPEILDWLGDSVTTHIGLSPPETATELARLLAQPEDGGHVYICGPGPMLDTARSTAAAAGWPDTAVHFEYFQNTTPIDTSSSFEVELVRSGLTLTVPGGRSIIDVLREHGVGVVSSCEQGACGTCLTTVLAGEPDHQDVHLNATERQAGNRMMICVSRSRSPRLVLDV